MGYASSSSDGQGTSNWPTSSLEPVIHQSKSSGSKITGHAVIELGHHVVFTARHLSRTKDGTFDGTSGKPYAELIFSIKT
jgi:hypothetical protein